MTLKLITNRWGSYLMHTLAIDFSVNPLEIMSKGWICFLDLYFYRARFCRAVTGLQITGLIRMPTKRRPDYVQRVAFGL
ncbi:hypothetical protein Patl1_15947 [Pistacia atlantica]|uniref:Uncharacterized protein n=1 Tax=Pistacia atlantica TaxID=434234 RepID=A0ACC1B6W9_9ROSI|nr:hypothetical protein Patl1_15947 [Pistacia atlantica]